MKNNIAFCINRGIGGNGTRPVIEQMSLLKEYEDQYNFIHFLPRSSLKGNQIIEKVTGIKISDTVLTLKLFEETIGAKKYDTWNDFLYGENWFADKYFEHLIVYTGMLSEATGLNRLKHRLEEYLPTKKQMFFRQNAIYIANILQSLKRAEECNAYVHEYMYDPLEMSIDQIPSIKPKKYKLYHGYNIPEYNAERLDSFAYSLLNIKKPVSLFEENETGSDFVFGYSASTKSRMKYVNKINSLVEEFKNKGYSTEIYYYHLVNGGKNIDTRIPHDKYLERLSKAKYTLVIPAYDETQFSIYRFTEAVYNGIIPLIGNDCKWKNFADTFHLDNNIIKKLITDYSSIPIFKESERREILNYLYDKLIRVERKFDIYEKNRV